MSLPRQVLPGKTYLLTCRCIGRRFLLRPDTHLNPVTASLVRTPQEWPDAVTTVDVLEAGTLKATRPSVWFKDNVPTEVTLQLTPPPCLHTKSAFVEALTSLLKT